MSEAEGLAGELVDIVLSHQGISDPHAGVESLLGAFAARAWEEGASAVLGAAPIANEAWIQPPNPYNKVCK